MSTLFSPDSVFLQRFLRSGGYYKGDIDGLVGPKTLAALGELEADTEQVANEIGSFDKQTEASIRTMLIPTQRKARQFMKNIAQAGLSQGFTVHILSGTTHVCTTS
jgi:peptidoglycan L-alanyl-D-glutamate endopeptidase CwlK